MAVGQDSIRVGTFTRKEERRNMLWNKKKKKLATHLCLKLALDKSVEYMGYTLNIH